MYQTMNIDTMLQTVIDNLNDCLAVGSDSKDDPSKGYPYAYGYSTAGTKIAIENLQTILEQYQSVMCETGQ